MPREWCVKCNSYQDSMYDKCHGDCGRDCKERCNKCKNLFNGALTSVNPSTLVNLQREQALSIGRTLDALVDQNDRNRYTASIEVRPNGTVGYNISAERK